MYDLHEQWEREGHDAYAMSVEQEIEEERWMILMDAADHMLIVPEAYTEREVMVMVERLDDLRFDDFFDWSQDLTNRATILGQLLEEAA